MLEGKIANCKNYLRKLLIVPLVAGSLFIGDNAYSRQTHAQNHPQKHHGSSYGCSHKAHAEEQDDGSYVVSVSLKFRDNRTGIILEPGKIAHIETEGYGCLNRNSCGGPDGVDGKMYALEASLFDITPVKENEKPKCRSYTSGEGSYMEIKNDSENSCELVFVMLDGPPDRIDICVASDYRNNINRPGFTSRVSIRNLYKTKRLMPEE